MRLARAATTIALLFSLHAFAPAQIAKPAQAAKPEQCKVAALEPGNHKPQEVTEVQSVDLDLSSCVLPPMEKTQQPAEPAKKKKKRVSSSDAGTQTRADENSIVSYRVGNQMWQKGSAPGQPLSVPVTSSDHFILLAQGDCTQLGPSKKCYPLALMVQTAKPKAKKDDPATMELTPAWRQLLIRNGDALQCVDKFDKFFADEPELRVVINGNVAVVGELTPPTPVEQPQTNATERQSQSDEAKAKAVKEALDKKIKAQNRSWAGRILDPESDLNVRIYSVPEGCRFFIPDDPDHTPKQPIDEIDIRAVRRLDQSSEDGIVVAPTKIFDSFVLKQKLAATATQLASLNAFSQAQLTAQVGTLQGITRDTSYFAAQLTTSPTPSVVDTATALTGNSVNTAALGNTGATATASVCPAGLVPTLPAGGTSVICSPLSAVGATNPVAPGQTTVTTNPATNQTVTTVTQPSQSVVTTSPTLTGTVPTAPTLNPLTPPANVGASASDTLDEQTRLNAQLITLQMLLQGASSDQLLLTHGRAIGQRAQTTLGFPISVDTPAQFEGAVAEVRILLLPRRSQAVTSQPVSIVNLLPSEKVYNVAKVTSNSKQFGAGVALQLVSFGFTTGKSKDRLYLAKDTDTVALQYPVGAGLSDLSPEGECDNLPPASSNFNSDSYSWPSAVMFGWQYRPVLGAVAVAPGVRTGFAQLALPQSDALAFNPEVWVQTRWRKYNQKKQITGDVYQESCHWRKLDDPVSVINPVVVKDVRVTDEGQGMLRFHATGDFFSSTGQVRSGSLSAPPQYFDGRSLEFFKLASDVLANGDLQLLDEAMHGYSLVNLAKNPAACRITDPKLSALPLADGTSLMELKYDRPNYQPDRNKDGPQHPLLLIGSNVYGLRDKPLLPLRTGALVDSACDHPAGDTAAHCKFKFLAKTEDIASAQNFLVRDPAWDSDGVTGSIRIDPTFTKIEAIAKPAAKDDSGSSTDDSIPGCPIDCKRKQEEQRKAKEAAAKQAAKQAKEPKKAKETKEPVPSTWFRLSGTNLSALEWALKIVDDAPARYCGAEIGCLQILEDLSNGTSVHVSPSNISIFGDGAAWLKLDKPSGIHIFWARGNWPASEWDLSLKEDKTAVTADPSVLYETDSRAVTFTGADFSKVTGVMFETTNLALVGAPTKAKLVVQVTSAVTAKYGHKELIAQAGVDDKGKPKLIALPVDVVKH
jgi:hypothetical protein